MKKSYFQIILFTFVIVLNTLLSNSISLSYGDVCYKAFETEFYILVRSGLKFPNMPPFMVFDFQIEYFNTNDGIVAHRDSGIYHMKMVTTGCPSTISIFKRSDMVKMKLYIKTYILSSDKPITTFEVEISSKTNNELKLVYDKMYTFGILFELNELDSGKLPSNLIEKSSEISTKLESEFYLGERICAMIEGTGFYLRYKLLGGKEDIVPFGAISINLESWDGNNFLREYPAWPCKNDERFENYYAIVYRDFEQRFDVVMEFVPIYRRESDINLQSAMREMSSREESGYSAFKYRFELSTTALLEFSSERNFLIKPFMIYMFETKYEERVCSDKRELIVRYDPVTLIDLYARVKEKNSKSQGVEYHVLTPIRSIENCRKKQ